MTLQTDAGNNSPIRKTGLSEADMKKEKEWWLGRMNFWLKNHNKPPAADYDEALRRIRREVPCTGTPGDPLVKIYPCARCGEFCFPCPDPEGLRLVDDQGVRHEEVYDEQPV